MSLQEWMDKTVSVITSDGRNIIGTLKGFDQTINLILEQSHERIYSEDRGVVQNVLGLYIIRYKIALCRTSSHTPSTGIQLSLPISCTSSFAKLFSFS